MNGPPRRAHERDRSLRQINPPLQAKLIMGHGSCHHPLSSDGFNVSVWLSESTSADKPDAYEAVNCLSCGRPHFVNKITGKLLSDKTTSDQS